MVKPSYCTSTSCSSFPCEHCKDCSHAIFKGTKKVNGIKYHWEFNPYFGYDNDNIDWDNKTLVDYLEKWTKRIKQQKEG